MESPELSNFDIFIGQVPKHFSAQMLQTVKMLSVYWWYNCLGQNCHWTSGIVSACACWSCKWGKVSIKQNKISAELKKKKKKDKEKSPSCYRCWPWNGTVKVLSLIYVEFQVHGKVFTTCVKWLPKHCQGNDGTASLTPYSTYWYQSRLHF